MEQSKTRNHRARHKTRASLLSDKGLDAANHNRASGGGRRIFLTSPLIEQAWLLKNSFQRFQLQKFVCKLLIVRLLRALQFAEITALVPFSTATGDSAHRPGSCVRQCFPRRSRRLASSAEKDPGSKSPSH